MNEKQKKLRAKYKDFGNPNPKKEAELKEAIISQRIGNCPEEIKKRCGR